MYYNVGRFGGHMWPFSGFPYGGYIMLLTGLVLIGLLVFIAVKKGRFTGSAADSPLEILQKRYVNGEISQEEYREMRDVLRK